MSHGPGDLQALPSKSLLSSFCLFVFVVVFWVTLIVRPQLGREVGKLLMEEINKI